MSINKREQNQHIDVEALQTVDQVIDPILFRAYQQDSQYKVDFIGDGITSYLGEEDLDSIYQPQEMLLRQLVNEAEASVQEDFKKSLPAENAEHRNWSFTLPINGNVDKTTWLELSSKIYPADDGITVWYGLIKDVTADREQIKADKEALAQQNESLQLLFKEINHRVKNNMQIISSLLNLQADQVSDENAKLYLKESQNRVQSMAIAHDILYNTTGEDKIELDDYLYQLVGNLKNTLLDHVSNHSVEVRADSIALSLKKVVVIGLLINELVTNALKHAFPEGNSGIISVSALQDEQGVLHLSVEDNGKGMEEDVDTENPSSLGMQIIHSLAHQLKGDFRFETPQGGGTRFVLQIKI